MPWLDTGQVELSQSSPCRTNFTKISPGFYLSDFPSLPRWVSSTSQANPLKQEAIFHENDTGVKDCAPDASKPPASPNWQGHDCSESLLGSPGSTCSAPHPHPLAPERVPEALPAPGTGGQPMDSARNAAVLRTLIQLRGLQGEERSAGAQTPNSPGTKNGADGSWHGPWGQITPK